MKAIAAFFNAYTHRKLLVVMCLGFSSGLPILLVGGTLGAWLQDNGLSRSTIGLFALVALPYSFNFLWAPFIDQLKLPYLTKRFGRRRGWMLLIQTLLLGAIAAFAYTDPLDDLMLVAAMAVLVAFLSASQDVVIDAFRAEYLDKTQYGQGAAMAVFGYRIGMMAAGAGALALADAYVWHIAYLVMAAAMVVGLFTTLLASEPQDGSLPQSDAPVALGAWLYRAVVMPFKDFMQRHKGWWLILLLILFYRLPDGFIGFITTPFFLDIGFEKSEVAAIAKLYGFGATLLGMFIGGGLIARLGVRKCLMAFLLFQIIANLTYTGLSIIGPNSYYLMFAISIDNLSGGMVTAVAIAYMMSLCNLAYTATQYALLSSLASLASKTIAGSAGFIADAHGWTVMFAMSAGLGILPVITLMVLYRKKLIAT